MDALVLALAVLALVVSVVAVIGARRGALRAEASARALGLVKVKGKWIDPSDVPLGSREGKQ